jgi:hypothetical protein
MEIKICVFCFETTEDFVCSSCNDYKGLMPISDAEEYLGEDLSEYV